jgi:hypothetical protein
MATIIDPAGTPVPVYNKSGKTVYPVTAAGTTSGAATQLTHYSELDIVLVTVPDNMDTGIKMPSGTDIGDRIEFYLVGGVYSPVIYPASGETFNGSSSPMTGVASLRKVSSTDWRTTT